MVIFAKVSRAHCCCKCGSAESSRCTTDWRDKFSTMISPSGRVLKLHTWVPILTSNAAWVSGYKIRA